MKPSRTVTVPIFATIAIGVWVVATILRLIAVSIENDTELSDGLLSAWNLSVYATIFSTASIMLVVAALLKAHREKMARIMRDLLAEHDARRDESDDRLKSSIIEAVGLQMIMLTETEEPSRNGTVVRLPKVPTV